MTPEEKIIYYTREMLIEKHGEEFLELDEESQNELVYGTILEYLEREREAKYE